MTKPPDEDDAGTPRWVWISAIVVIALASAVVVLHLTGNGFGGHTP
ncbi:hypothetical protein [Saccharothrix sp. NRRL B-16348]|nr:hypothetical protein [Saccharothrix sp. NRRL B-16348]